MNTAWFIVLGALLVGYAVFDGVDLGVGAMHLILGKSDRERRTNLNAIGPFWFGYEVWLVVAGGAMVAAFPRLYAASFSGFYLVLTLVLWLLIARGTSIEFRSHVASPLWRGFWDVAFCGASALLAVLFGAAVGNVVRGVPLDATGNFQGSFTLALNPFALLVGVLSLALLAMHGANYIAFRSEDDQQARARLWAGRLWAIVAALSVAATGLAFWARPSIGANFLHFPVLIVLPLGAVAALIAVRLFQRRGYDSRAVVMDGVFIAALMGSAGASLYPSLLPMLGQTGGGLTVFNAAAPHHTLVTAFVTVVFAMAVVIGYSLYIHRVFRGTVRVGADEHDY
jgi:cytochrome d ubiquinol oxidase subunit II